MIVCAVQNFVHTVAVNDFASMSLHDRIGGRPFSNGIKIGQTSRVIEHLFFLFFFLFSFFLWSNLSLFLLLPLAFVLFSLITHICFSLFESGVPRWLHPTPLFDVRHSRQPPGKRMPRQLPCPLLVKQSF